MTKSMIALSLLLLGACAPARAPAGCPMMRMSCCEHGCASGGCCGAHEHSENAAAAMPMGAMHVEGMMPGHAPSAAPERPREMPHAPMMGHHGDRMVMRELASLGVRFYAPRMLLRRSADIGLTPDQLTKIRQEVLGAQAHRVDLQAKMEKARIEAMRLLAADKVDEHAVDAQIDEATKAGAELRKLMVGVMLRVRDVLTPEQRKKLDEHGPPGPEGKQAAGSDQDEDDMDDMSGPT